VSDKEPTRKGHTDDAGNDANGRRRRRRRGGGLRVPSDKVPRASAHRELELGEPPEPPAPEAPDLAVSVAAAFGGEEDAEVDTEGREPSRSGGEEPPGDVEAVAVDGVAADQAAPESGAVAEPASSDSDPASAEPGGEEHGGVVVESQAASPEAAEERADEQVMARAAQQADEGPLGEEDLADEPYEGDAEGEDRPMEPRSPDRSPDESSPEGPAPVGQAADSQPVASQPDEIQPVDIEIDEDPPVRRPHRAQTEALTEEDLEELMEAIEDDDDEVEAEAEAEPPVSRRARDDDEVDFDAQETAQFVPVVIDEDDDDGGDVARRAAVGGVTILERREAARAAPRDPGDSAEMLSDELVEEVEELEEAMAAESSGKASAEEGVGSSRTTEVLDAVEVEELAEQAREEEAAERSTDPPPVPGEPGVAKPPPAPSPTPASPITQAGAQVGKGRAGAVGGKAWFEEIFDEDYLRTLPFLTPQATQAEAKFVADAVAVSAGAQLLDLGCGYGRHAMELAARGFHVVGLDSSLPLLLRGADEAQRRGLSINFVHGDMRELTFDSQFDAAYCLFSTFGYFDDETNKKTAQNVARALKPGARFVVEVLNRDYLIQDLPARVWWEGDGCVVLEEVDFNYFSSRIVSNRSVVFDDGRQLEQEISIRAYSLHELGKLLHAAGFRVLEVSGSMNTRGRFFGAKARDIIVVAEKRATS
jgi:SAM-dependent methyltransferase